jgi:hypothetical protein
MTCPASIKGSEHEVGIEKEPGPATAVGTAVHAILRDVVENRWTRLPDIGPYCIDAGCSDQDRDVRILCYGALKFLAEYRAFLSEDPIVEASRTYDHGEDVTLAGRADILDYVDADGERVVYVIDWKTGEYDDASRYRYQMLGYAALGMAEFAPREPTRVIVILAWLRSMETTVVSYQPSDVTQFLDDMSYTVNRRATAETYTPGQGCTYCPRVAVCPGRTAMLQNAVEVLTGGDTAMVPVNGQLVDAEGFARSITQARLLKSLCEEHLRTCVEAVRSMGGEVPLDDGGKVTLVSRAGAMKLKPEKVIPALRAQFGAIPEDELLSMVSLTKKSIDAFLESRADADEKKALYAALEEMGAATRGSRVEYVQVKGA